METPPREFLNGRRTRSALGEIPHRYDPRINNIPPAIEVLATPPPQGVCCVSCLVSLRFQIFMHLAILL